MAGYLPDSETAAAFTDGWYRTGDIGYLDDDGWLRITDRLKEMVKVRGFQVAPAEIEAVLHGHPAVRDCAVFGVPDGLNGEAVVAAVATEKPVAAEELVGWSPSSWRPTSAPVTSSSSPRSHACRRARRCGEF